MINITAREVNVRKVYDTEVRIFIPFYLYRSILHNGANYKIDSVRLICNINSNAKVGLKEAKMIADCICDNDLLIDCVSSESFHVDMVAGEGYAFIFVTHADIPEPTN